MFDCVFLMAGKGERSQLDINKVYYKINNKPLFKYSLDVFLDIEECNKIVLVVREDEYNRVSHLSSSRIKIVYGGQMRQDSVASGVIATSEKIVLIHDAARYNVSKDDIIQVYLNTIDYQAAVLATKVTDTIKTVSDYKVVNTLDRNTLWAMQTPQGVKRDLYLDCLKKARQENYYGTDDVELLEKYANVKARIVPGHHCNYKLTNAEDIIVAEAILKEKNNV
jgi:2-C-methyl-D-erythritol 4-phosphate cytidylyltransferase